MGIAKMAHVEKSRVLWCVAMISLHTSSMLPEVFSGGPSTPPPPGTVASCCAADSENGELPAAVPTAVVICGGRSSGRPASLPGCGSEDPFSGRSALAAAAFGDVALPAGGAGRSSDWDMRLQARLSSSCMLSKRLPWRHAKAAAAVQAQMQAGMASGCERGPGRTTAAR